MRKQTTKSFRPHATETRAWTFLTHIPIMIALMLFALYGLYTIRTLPLAYYDEAVWAGQSYFFDLYLKHDWSNTLWKDPNGIDQPKLIQYIYGASLYPLYLKHRPDPDALQQDYLSFLATNNLLCFECIDPEIRTTYATQYDWRPIIEFDTTPSSLVDMGLGPTVRLIMVLRYVNLLFVLAAAYTVYLIGKMLISPAYGLLLMVLYCLNPLHQRIVYYAHADGLFLFLYALTFLCIILFVSQPSLSRTVVVGVMSGLTASTKLHGFIFPVVFVAASVLLCGGRQESRKRTGFRTALLYALTAGVVALGVFTLLHPVSWNNPVATLRSMYEWRIGQFAVDASLFTPAARIAAIGNRFFGTNAHMNMFPVINPPILASIIWSGLFILGCVSMIQNRKKTHDRPLPLIAALLLSFMLGLLLFQLYVDWDRYHAVLLLPIVLVQVYGLQVFIRALGIIKTRAVRVLFG